MKALSKRVYTERGAREGLWRSHLAVMFYLLVLAVDRPPNFNGGRSDMS